MKWGQAPVTPCEAAGYCSFRPNNRDGRSKNQGKMLLASHRMGRKERSMGQGPGTRNRAAREEEIQAHGKPIMFRGHLHKSKKKYDRKQLKKAITQTDDGFLLSWWALST